MTAIRAILLATAMVMAAPAVAGTVYRCDSPDGGRSYVSKRVSGAKCEAVSSYRATAIRGAPVASPQATAATITTEAAGASANAVNVARNLDAGAPVSFTGATTAGALRGATSSATIAATAIPAAAKTPTASAAPRSTKLVQGQVYSFIVDGVRHYTSKAPKNVVGATAMRTIKYSFLETCYACAADPGVNFGTLRLNTAAYAAEIAAAGRAYGVDESIVRAIIHAESAFNPRALSRVGAQGLMQLMPATARRFGVDDSFNAAQNIQGGVQYLAFLLKRFNGDLTLAAAGYNAGEGAVDKYKGVPPYSETQRYVQRVGVLAARYRGTLVSAK